MIRTGGAVGPYVFANALLAGFFGFAAVYHLVMWTAWRRDRLLLFFGVRCLLAAALGTVIVGLCTAQTPDTAQRFINARFSTITLGVVAGGWTLSLLTGVRARAYLWLVTVVFVTLAAINTLLIPLTATVLSVEQVTLPWGESLSILHRGPVRWWIGPLYALGASVDAFGT